MGTDWRVWPEQICRSGWRTLFDLSVGAPLQLHVDIGFGQGEFLTALARQNPAAAIVGVDISFKRVLKLARRLARSELRNIRLVGIDAAWVVRESFEDSTVSVFWINFPDPWPKRRHQRRRFVEPGFIGELSRRLKTGGSLHIATDDPDYAAAIRFALEGERLLENTQAADSQPSDRRELPPTAFEREWAAQRRACFFFQYRRVKTIAASRSGQPSQVAS